MSTKFEQLLDYLVNEEMDKANELFHEIVVEKSREIYETMIAEEADQEESVDEADDQEDESVDEADDQEDEAVEEGFGGMDDAEDDETSMSIGGDNDPADSLGGDVAAPADDGEGDFGGEGEGEVSSGEEQILDVLQQLKQEFDAIVNGGGSDDTGEEEPAEPAEPSFGDEEPADDEEEEEEPEAESMGMPMREYVEKVGNDWEKNSMKTPGPVGSGKGDLAGQATETNSRSPISSGSGKPTSTATAKNLNQAGKGVGEMSGTKPNAKGNGGGVLKTGGEFTNGGTHNVNGVKSGIKTVSKVGATNRTSEFQPVGAATGGPAGQTGSGNTRSVTDRKQ